MSEANEPYDIYWFRFQMMMGFSDTLLRTLGLMPSYGMMEGDIRIGNIHRNLFDDIVREISLGRIDIANMPAHSEDPDDFECDRYADEQACADECSHLDMIAEIWQACCGKDGLRELRTSLLSGKGAEDVARKFGVDQALKALDFGVPVEDIAI